MQLSAKKSARRSSSQAAAPRTKRQARVIEVGSGSDEDDGGDGDVVQVFEHMWKQYKSFANGSSKDKVFDSFQQGLLLVQTADFAVNILF